MSIFGWSYPPGCNGTPYDEDDGFNTVCEWFQEVVFADFPSVIDVGWLAEEVAGRFGKLPQDVVDAIKSEAIRWSREQITQQSRNSERPSD